MQFGNYKRKQISEDYDILKGLEYAKMFASQSLTEVLNTYLLKGSNITSSLNTKYLYNQIIEKCQSILPNHSNYPNFFSDLFDLINMITGCLSDIMPNEEYFSHRSINQFCMTDNQVITYKDALKKLRGFIGMIFVQLFVQIEYLKSILTDCILKESFEMSLGKIQQKGVQDLYSLIFANNFSMFFSCLKDEVDIEKYAKMLNSDKRIYQFASFIASVSKASLINNDQLKLENELIMLPILMSFENEYYKRAEHQSFLRKSVNLLFSHVRFKEPPNKWALYLIKRIFSSYYNINFDFLRDYEELILENFESMCISSFITKKKNIKNFDREKRGAETEKNKILIVVKFLQTFKWVDNKKYEAVMSKFIKLAEDINKEEERFKNECDNELNRRRLDQFNHKII